MKNSSTLFLKTVVVLIGAAVLFLLTTLFPLLISSPEIGIIKPIFIGMYLPAIPFFIGIYQTLKLLSSIEANKVFSKDSVQALKHIKYCALIVSGLYILGLPYIVFVANQDDAPGLVLIGLIFAFAPLAIAVFSALLQKLLQDVINIKSENDQII